MKMRHFWVLLLLLAGCASPHKQKHSTHASTDNAELEPLNTPSDAEAKDLLKEFPPENQSRYVGQRGYFNRPPIFLDKSSELIFQRCLPIEIVRIQNVGTKTVVVTKQNGKLISIIGLNRKTFEKNSKSRQPLLDRFFVKNLEWAKERQMASLNSSVCLGQTRRDMPTEQFQFINGDPELRQPLKDKKATYDVWTYVSADRKTKRHYYFFAGYLYSWTK